MSQQAKPPITQRAYTFRLRGADSSDTSWRKALWRTHEAVNKGAKAFGDWLLTLRGGLDHTLADAKVRDEKGKHDRDPTPEERKARRILLVLSWLSVESRLGAPERYIIASGNESTEDRNRKVTAALEEILKSRNVVDTEIAEWKTDCSDSLSAAIRDDAVWVNRSKAFDEAVKSVGSSLTREEVWDMLESFFGSRDAYLAPAKGSEDESSEIEPEEKAKDLVQKAGQWLSSRFGTGKGADFSRMAEVYEKIAAWADNAQEDMTGNDALDNLAAALSEFDPAPKDLQGVLGLISGPGYKSATRNLLNQLADKATVTQQDLAGLKDKATSDAQKCKQNSGSKGRRPYADAILKDVEEACGFTYRTDKDSQNVSVSDYSKYGNGYNWGPARHSEFAVILDHAARHVSLAHTWIKRAEAERRRFEEDTKKMANVPSPVKDWLDSFCAERSGTSGALEPYRIRRRAVDGWDAMVKAWSKPGCKTKEDRIAAARELQDNPDINKFGDIQLFEALAEDDALCVWHKDGDPAKSPDHQSLIDYVLASEAEFKKRQYKVPAYRHPDPLLHPVFCDFGCSRWDIRFEVHKNRQTSDSRRLTLTLWTGSMMASVPLWWQSKRLARDLALSQDAQNDGSSEVARADRLGRAASNVTKSNAVKIAGLFEQKDWNGRLQAPREQLEAIAAVKNNSRLSASERERRILGMINRIRWLMTFSAKLQPQGPWYDYAKLHGLRSDPQYWPHSDVNNDRNGHAKLILSRLPGLRVLSIDLGHRYAAACAVWETLSAQQVSQACHAAGHEAPKDSDLYLHLKKKVTKQKKGKPVDVEETTIYRRIGADTLPDGTPHPAPWARLDRQFLIKLQGEEEGAREASNEEIWAVHRLESELGRTVPLIDKLVAAGWGITDKQKARLEAFKQLGWEPTPKSESADNESGEDMESDGYRPSLAVDELMSSAIRTMCLALNRHGDRARIAHYLITDEKNKPGGIKEKLDESGRIDLLQDALVMWHDLFSSRGWRDDAARQLWDEYVARLSGYKAPEEFGEEYSGQERKKKQKENRDKLYAAAKAMAQDETIRKTLHDVWKKRWEDDDERWKKQLRWFKDWVLPRGRHAGTLTIRKVGGLSLTRLATLTEFRRKVQVGFFTRLCPNGTRAETKEQFGQKAIDALEHLREQRIKQLASRIVEAALGIGSEASKHWDKGKRPRHRINDPRFAPCHAIIIEDLTNYRPEETRTRRENRQLMTWSSSKVKKYLAEACQLHGLHLREVSAGYTSRQDSRTGAPGIRCQDVPIKEFIQSPFWRKQVKQAEAKQAENKGDARERFLCHLNAMWKDKTVTDWEKARIIRVPLKCGDVFVSADPVSPAAKGLQADLNAAANIGLRALTDPDWPGKWWYVPCDPTTFKPTADRVKGSTAIKLDEPLKDAVVINADVIRKKAGKTNLQSKEVLNLWCDISSSALNDKSRQWKEYADYQADVQCRVIQILLEEEIKIHNMQSLDVSKEEDIPF